MSSANTRIIDWPHPDDSGRPGVAEINGEEYEFAPVPAGDLGPDECGRVIVWKRDARRPATYVCRAYFGGHISCDCPDSTFRKRGQGNLCKHALAMRDFGILGMVAAEPTGQPPW